MAIAACTPPADKAVESEPVVTPPPAEEPVSARCDAQPYQSFVGKNKSEIPEPPLGISFRVACTTCPVTDDARSDRLNFYFDEATGIIKEVRCI
jgi:hypothetical protein